MDEFIQELKNNGVINVDFSSMVGPEKKDTLAFQINDKIFIIESGRGGNILGGSYLSCDVIDAK